MRFSSVRISVVAYGQVEKDMVEVLPKKGPIGKTFKKDAAVVMKLLSQLEGDDVTQLENAINNGRYGIVFSGSILLSLCICRWYRGIHHVVVFKLPFVYSCYSLKDDDARQFEMTADMVQVKRYKKTVHGTFE